MNQELRDAVFKLIRRAEEKHKHLDQEPRSLSTLRESALKIELMREINELKAILKSKYPESDFKKRCQWRVDNPDKTIAFSSMPDSPSNRLYWKIAALIFKPKTMGEMLQIILPSIKYQVTVSVEPSKSCLNLKEGMRNPEIGLYKTSVDEHNLPPTLEELSHFVICNDKVFYVPDISLLTLRLHTKLQYELRMGYPDILDKFYRHNESLQSLNADIKAFNNNGITPKEAITQLSKGLALGGSKYTGNIYATKPADEAIKHFFDYFNALPDKTKEKLRSLAYHGVTIGTIIDNEIGKGTCVESASSHLDSVLKENSNNPLLSEPSNMSPDELKNLEQKYKSLDGFNTKKNSLLTFQLPMHLKYTAISKMHLDNFQDVLTVLLNFPPEHYNDLSEQIAHNNREVEFAELTVCVKNRVFNEEQRDALAKVLVKNYSRYHFPEPCLFWALSTNEPLFIKEAVSYYPEALRVDAVKTNVDAYGNTVLHKAKDNSDMQQTVLLLLPAQRRIEVLRVKNNTGNTSLSFVAPKPARLKTLVELLPTEHRLEAVKVATDSNGETLLYKARDSIESVQYILGLYPKNQRLNVIMQQSKGGNSLANSIKKEHLKGVMTMLPESHRLSFLKSPALISPYRVDKILNLLLTHGESILNSDEGFKDSFIPDLMLILKFLQRKKYSLELLELTTKLLSFNSLEEIKGYLITYIDRHIDCLLRKGLLQELTDPKCHPKAQFEVVKERWYRTTVLNYLEEQIYSLPKTSTLRNKLKEILAEVQKNKKPDLLKESVTQIKSVVDTHQDTGIKGFFKCTWARHTANYNQLARLFDFEHGNEFKL